MKISKDLFQYSKGNKLVALKVILFNQGFHAVCIYRLASWIAKVKFLRFISKLLTNLNRILYGVEIDYRSRLAGGFKITHGTGLVIGEHVVSKGNLHVYQSVILGNGGTYGSKKKMYEGKKISQPVLGNNVIIFANAQLCGPVIVGDNAKIGAGTMVFHDIPEGAVVFNKRELIIK